MSMHLHKMAAVVGLSLLTGLAHAATNLVVNGSFESTTNPAKGFFTAVGPTGWSGGGALTFVDAPGTADDLNQYLAVYGPFPATSPDGGNFVEADGDPNYSGAFWQTIDNLTVGQVYQLTFYQAAGQQYGFTGPTTERWQVTFGADTQLSTLVSLPQGGVGPWTQETMQFTATSTSQVLSFLAAGTPGGAPPISFIDGINLQAVTAVPEPATLSMFGVGALLIGAARLRRPAKASTEA